MSNTKWQKSLARIIINVKTATTSFPVGTKSTTFQDWLFGCTIDKKNLILGVEKIKDTALRIFFDKEHLAQVKHAIHHLYPTAMQVFGATVLSTILDEDELKSAKSSHETELSHSNRLQQLTGNPQGPDESEDNTQPMESLGRCYFGSYAEVTAGNITQTSDLTQDTESDDLRTTVTKLTESYNELKKSFESTLTTTIENIVNKKIKPLQDQVNEIETSQNTKYENFMNLLKQKEEASEKKFDAILKLLGVNTQAPSDATRSPGVGP